MSRTFLLFIFAAVMVSAKVHSLEAASAPDALSFDDAKTIRNGRSLPQEGYCPDGSCSPPDDSGFIIPSGY